MFKISDLGARDIINVVDGRRLGPIKDVQIDQETGTVQAIVLRGGSRYLRLLRLGRDVVVPWSSIRKIGVDAVLVEVNPADGVR
ncbi:MAG: YlmC/YmxH family sporulation protein [Bacillota bacterium]